MKGEASPAGQAGDPQAESKLRSSPLPAQSTQGKQNPGPADRNESRTIARTAALLTAAYALLAALGYSLWPAGAPSRALLLLIGAACFVLLPCLVARGVLRRSSESTARTHDPGSLPFPDAEDPLSPMLARAVESATDSIVITDLTGSIEYVNPAFEQHTGYTRAEVYGQNPRVLNSGRQPREFYAELWRTLKRGGVWQGRFVNRRKDGTLYTEEATIAPVLDADGVPHKYVAVKRDITQLEELQSELRQSQKMEAVGQLAGGIAHDLNNVLQVITLASHLALGNPDPEFKDARLRESLAAALKGAGVIRQLLAFGRRQLLRMEVVSLNQVIRETEILLRHLLRENISLGLDLAEDLANIKADPVQITQVILNLAVNACDAMPEGGRLEIGTGNSQLAPSPTAGQTRIPSGRYVCLRIRDTGCGMDEATISHIFEPFFTTKEVGKGTGLGLSTAYGIISQSGGYIDCESAPGAGTTFFIYFPPTDEALTQAANGTLLPRQSEAIPYSVLVVEDEPMVRRSIAEALQRAGFQVHTSGSSQEACEIALREHPSLVIADVVMNGMKGTELVERLRRQNPSIRTIFMSGYTEDAKLQSAIKSQGALFIPKPFTINQLVESAVKLCQAKL